jgi:hypothetical protein
VPVTAGNLSVRSAAAVPVLVVGAEEDVLVLELLELEVEVLELEPQPAITIAAASTAVRLLGRVVMGCYY